MKKAVCCKYGGMEVKMAEWLFEIVKLSIIHAGI